VNSRLYETALGLSEFRAVAGINGDVAEGRCAVVLDIDVCRREELDKYRDGASVDQLLAVIVWIMISKLNLGRHATTTYLNVSCSAMRRWRSFARACPWTWPDA